MATDIAVLDDYQEVAPQSAGWSDLSRHATITVFNDHIAQAGDLRN